MIGVAGFIDYDGNGRPFIGLLWEDGGIQVKVYLAHKETASVATAELIRQLKQMTHDLMQTPDKLVAVEGDINAIVRKSEGHNGERARVVRNTDKRRP
jgi:hypothetical protein